MTSGHAVGGPRLVVVTGGGGGIGAAIAEELGRQGAFVVTFDPLVTLDGSAVLPPPDETTAGRIVAAGGAARASSVSVTDRAAVRAELEALVAEHGRLDAVINVAGITRPTSYLRGTAADWHDVLDVHLGGYLNVLAAALPLMAKAGYGRVLGVTSGSGWRPADTGAYGCAKRAVAALTWQLGALAPPGVVINAISPIAVTRMVTAALGRAPQAKAPGGGGAATGGLSLGSMPAPEELGPVGAHLVDDQWSWCSGQIFFVAGSEAAVIEAPRLLEVVRTDGGSSSAAVLAAATTKALVPAQAEQRTAGGSNPRFAGVYRSDDADPAASADEAPTCDVRRALVVSDRPDVVRGLGAELAAVGIAWSHLDPGTVVAGGDRFAAVAAALTGAVDADGDTGGPVDAIVLALAGGSSADRRPPTPAAAWEPVLADHDGLVDRIHTDAAWARAVAELATADGAQPVRLVTITDATTAGGRSRGQAVAQHARAAAKATGDRVRAFAVASEGATPSEAAAVARHLLTDPDASALAGAELVAGPGWFGVRSHPHPTASLVYGGPELPLWFDDAVRGILGIATCSEEDP